MVKWEYCILENGEDQDALNTLGEEGWELVCVNYPVWPNSYLENTNPPDTQLERKFWYFFKRQKTGET